MGIVWEKMWWTTAKLYGNNQLVWACHQLVSLVFELKYLQPLHQLLLRKLQRLKCWVFLMMKKIFFTKNFRHNIFSEKIFLVIQNASTYRPNNRPYSVLYSKDSPKFSAWIQKIHWLLLIRMFQLLYMLQKLDFSIGSIIFYLKFFLNFLPLQLLEQI